MKNKKKFIVAIDQGTTSSRAILFNIQGKSLFKSQLEIKQYFPKSGWVEQNPNEIWNKTKKVLIEVVKKSKAEESVNIDLKDPNYKVKKV